MASGYCTQELERVAIQLLPPEIVAEIGIADDTVNSTATACRSHAVIEGLATHLANILGLAVTGMETQHRPRPANAAQRNEHVSRILTTNGGETAAHVAPGSGKNDGMILCPGTITMFATPLAAPPAGADLLMRQSGRSGTGVFLPERHHNGSGGTGVFLPLAGAYRTRPFKSPSSKGMKPPRLMRKEGGASGQWE